MALSLLCPEEIVQKEAGADGSLKRSILYFPSKT